MGEWPNACEKKLCLDLKIYKKNKDVCVMEIQLTHKKRRRRNEPNKCDGLCFICGNGC